MSKYKYLLFDIDDTLINFENLSITVQRRSLSSEAVKLPTEMSDVLKSLMTLYGFLQDLKIYMSHILRKIITGSITNMWKIHWIKQLTNLD